MRKITIFIVCILLVGTFFVVAPDTVFADQDGDYTYTVSDGVATITGYTGSGGAITIPSTLGGYPTIHIGASAFSGLNNVKAQLITSVIIPDSVNTIGEEAFAYNTNLISVIIGSGFNYGDPQVFNHCTSLLSINLLMYDLPDVCICWVDGTSPQIRGHATEDSHFPAPGTRWDAGNLTMGEYIDSPPPSNSLPVFGTPSPRNGSTGNMLSLSWSIPINDSDGNTFSWTIQCTNGQMNSGNGASNGTKSLSLSGLAYSTAYKVWVNATDPAGSNQYTCSWFTFTTKASTPPVFGTPSPENGSTENLLSLTWNIPINDSEGNTFFWTIQCSNGQANGGTSANNGTKSLALSGLAYLTTYKVWVNATDSTGSSYYTKKWYTFTTQQQPNVPPDKPKTPIGSVSGDTGVSYVYSSNTTDYNRDQVYYLWDWGDGTNGEWTGPYENGDICQESHIWSAKGSYNIRVKAKDTSGAESVWSDPFPITMPYSYDKSILQFLELLFERFPNAFPLLRQLMWY